MSSLVLCIVPPAYFLACLLWCFGTKITGWKCRKKGVKAGVSQHTDHLCDNFFAGRPVNDDNHVANPHVLVRVVVYAGFDNFMAVFDLFKNRMSHLRIMRHMC